MRVESNAQELIERLSGGRSTIVGSWTISKDDVHLQLVDEAAKHPAATFRWLTEGRSEEQLLNTHRVTGILIERMYKDDSDGHIIAIIPDDQIMGRTLRRALRKMKEWGHWVIDIQLCKRNSFPAGLALATTEEILRYATASHPNEGKVEALLDFVLTR